MPTFAQKIEALRLRRGWSQRALARVLNEQGVEVSQRAVSNWERGAEPRPEMIAACSSLFGVTTELLTDDSRALPEPSRKEAVIEEMPSDTKWHDLSKEEKHRLVLAVMLDNKDVRAQLERHPQYQKIMAALEGTAQGGDAEHAAADRDLQKAKAQGKFIPEAPPGQKNRPA